MRAASFINQGKYARELVKHFGMDSAKESFIPMAKNAKLDLDDKRKESGRKTVSRYDWQFIISYC